MWGVTGGMTGGDDRHRINRELGRWERGSDVGAMTELINHDLEHTATASACFKSVVKKGALMGRLGQVWVEIQPRANVDTENLKDIRDLKAIEGA